MSQSEYLDSRPRLFNHTFCMNLPALCYKKYVLCEAEPPKHHTSCQSLRWLAGSHMRLRQELLPPKERRWEQSLRSSAPVLRAARWAQPCPALRKLQSAWRWRRWCRPGDTSWKPAAPGHSWEGAAAAASAAALAQPQDIYVPPQPGSRPVPFYFFSFKETPAEGKRESNRFFQQILVQTMKKSFQERSCFYRYLLPWKVRYLPSTSILL